MELDQSIFFLIGTAVFCIGLLICVNFLNDIGK